MYLLLLVLEISLNLSSDASHKQKRFFNILFKKNFDFIASKKDNIITFYLNFILLPAKINFIPEKRNHKKDAIMLYGSSRVKIILILSTKIVSLYI